MRRLAAVIAATTLTALPLTASPLSSAATPTCFGQPATIVGTDGPDIIYGTAGHDVIYGGGGNDNINTNWSPNPPTTGDLICGGPGDDQIEATDFNDKVNGGDGSDVVSGGAYGADVVNGNAGNDEVNDGPDCDWDDDPSGPDIMRGGIGDDQLCAMGGTAKMYGDAGKDTIRDFGKGKGWLYGGLGNDTLDASFGVSSPGDAIAPDYLSGDGGYDQAQANYEDTVTSSTEKVTRVANQ